MNRNSWVSTACVLLAVAAVSVAHADDVASADRRVEIHGNGGVSFRVTDPSWRKKVNGFLSKCPKPPPTTSVAWESEQHWIVLWNGNGKRSIRQYATDGLNMLFPMHPDGESDLSILSRPAADAAKLGVPLECDESGVLGDLKVFDHPVTHTEAVAELYKWRRATLSLSAHFGTEGCAKTVEVTAAPGRVRDLAGATIELLDGQDQAVEPARTVRRNGQVEKYVLKLPFGDYRFRLSKDGKVLAETRYGVLSASSRYLLKGVDGNGRPNRMELVRTIKPDPARLGPNAFRNVGETHFGELNGVRYLETGLKQWDRFAIRFKVDTNTPLHCIEIDYPDDRKRTMDILVQDSKYGSGGSGDFTLAVGLATGGEEYRNQNRILTHRCLFWTGSRDDVSLVVSARTANEPAAISEVRLYKVPDSALPAAGVREPPANGKGMRRFIGQFWEDPAVIADFRRRHRNIRDMDELIDRHIAQMRYSGQNMLAYTGAWYHGIVGLDGYNVRDHRAHYLEAYYEKFDRAGMCLMPVIELRNIPGSVRGFNANSLKDGSLHGTSFSIRDNGEALHGWHRDPPNYNVAHPAVQAEVSRIVAVLADEGKAHPSFKGVTLFLPVDVCTWWGTIKSGYNDYCIDAFTKATGIRVPVDRADPLRGKAYAEWLKANAYEKWVQWRCDVVTDFYARLARILSERRADLQLRLDVEPPADVVLELEAHPDYYTDAMRPRLMREAGIDAEALRRKIPNLVFGTVAFGVRQRKKSGWLKDDKVRERYIGLPETRAWWAEALAEDFPSVVIRDDFFESDVGRTSKGERALNGDWFKEHPWRVSAILPSAHNAMKYFALPLRHGDILGISRGGFLICDYGMEEREVAFAKAFRALPAVKMQDVSPQTAAETDVRVRACTFEGKSYFYLVNTGDRPVTVSVMMPDGARDLSTGKPAGNPRGWMDVALDAYSIKSFSAPSGKPAWHIVELARVDCFWGSGGTEVGPSEGVARGWTWEKAQTGNCHPGATLPFGWMSAVAYSGAYPTGYGVWERSSGGPAKRFLDRPEAWGITHVQHSGVGAIRQYYNLIRITPCVEGADLSKRSRLADERAEPGYYAASLPDYGSSFELAAVSTTAMAHRYRYASPGGRLEIDLKNLAIFGLQTDRIDRVDLKMRTKDTWCGTIWPYGVPVHFALRMNGAEESVLAISRESVDVALSEADAALAAGFDAARAKAALTWQKTLGRIRAKFADSKLEGRFYSALYHSLLNPSDQRVGFCDFATVWDMYRTQLPLVMLSQPETADRIAMSMFAMSETHGFFPNWCTLLQRYDRSDVQAIALPAYVMADLFHAGAVRKEDFSRLMPFFAREFSGIDVTKHSPTHILDLAGAYDAAATVADETGNCSEAKEWRAKSAIWRTAYDPQTGLMPKGAKYYEGNEMNYSFRPHVDMDERMELVGGKAKFEKLLDDFFAFNDDLSGWTPETDRIKRPGRFEGLNNESDMDSISSYYFVGRPDRVAELHDLVRRTRFADGPGGLPGNNDSGATSSWYVLSSLGLVPQSGSPYWFVTIPSVESAEVKVRGGRLSIKVDSRVMAAPGLAKAYFNGRELIGWRIPTRELMSGGVLEFKS